MLSIFPFRQSINTSITIPGSKSDTNRALVLASLSDGVSILNGISQSDDSMLMIENLIKLGIKITEIDTKTLEVCGNGGNFKPFFGELNSGIAGTTSRFLAAICTLVPGEFVLNARGKMLDRPMKELLDGLASLGSMFEFLGNPNCLPIRFASESAISGGSVSLNGQVSSQFFTALLLIAPVLANGLQIQVIGEQVSQSYIDMTQSILADFGIEMKNENYTQYIINSNQKLISQPYQIQGDASGCSYFWGIAALTESTVRIQNINPETTQGDIQFADILEKMGCRVVKNLDEKWIQVTGSKNLIAVDVNMENLPDTAQTLAVIAAFATGTTRITGLSTLKKKETDRLSALHTELKRINITTRIGEDWIEIDGGKPIGTTIETYHDHRMAMSFTIAGCKIQGITIQNPEVVSKSFPDFWDKLSSLGIETRVTTQYE